MDSWLYIAFILTSAALIVVPGPNVLVIVSTTISHGTKRGIQTVLGTSSAMLIQLLIAALGTAWFVETVTQGFEWLRWLGATYLIYLGLQHLFKVYQPHKDEKAISASSTFTRGFLVSLTNPKTILFFGAFLPQFASPNGDYTTQILVLSATFLCLATLLDALYAIAAGRVRNYIQSPRAIQLQHGLSGILFMGAGAWLAFARKG